MKGSLRILRQAANVKPLELCYIFAVYLFNPALLSICWSFWKALRSLLFPLEWQSVYVPQLPYALAGYLEAPGGLMIGMVFEKGEIERGTEGTATVVRDLGLEG